MMVTHIIPQNVWELVDVYGQLSMLAAVADVEPGEQQDEEDEHGQVGQVGQGLQAHHPQEGSRDVEDHHHREQDRRGAGRREQVLPVVVLTEVVEHALNFFLPHINAIIIIIYWRLIAQIKTHKRLKWMLFNQD